MPIKFSCPHCSRRLSVSSKRANTAVVCPKCEQTLTVPATSKGTSTQREGKRKKEKKDSAPPVASQNNPFAEFEVFDLPPTESDKASHEQRVSRTRQIENQAVNPSTLAVPRHVLYLQGGLLLALAVVAFSLGLLVGGQGGLRNDRGAAGLQPVAVSGKVTYLSDAGLTNNDNGCAVILLPRETYPSAKIAVEGLAPGDGEPTLSPHGIAEIERIGGGHDWTDGKGEFQMKLPSGGRFFLLVISSNKDRSRDIDTNELAEIGTYFDSTKELLGDREYRWTKEVIRDDRTMPVKF